MADSMILATAQVRGVTLWSQDSDFEYIAGVKKGVTGSPGQPLPSDKPG